MQITRSTKCSLRWATDAKRNELRTLLREYGDVVNFFIAAFWAKCPRKAELLKPIVDQPTTWLNYTLRQTAAREAIDMIKASKERHGRDAVMPTHKGKTMRVSTSTAKLVAAISEGLFALWLEVKSSSKESRGSKISIPVQGHKHKDKLERLGGKLCGSFVISENWVQLAYTIERGEPRSGANGVGIDTGIKKLASLSNGLKYGDRTQAFIDRIRRCKQGSKGREQARRAYQQYIAEVAKRIASSPNIDFVVIEDLTGIADGTKRKARLRKNMRATVATWCHRLWRERLEMALQLDRVQCFAVEPAYTSQTCASCGFRDRRSRNGERFCCLSCGHKDDADINAAKNILARYLGGVEGPACKGLSPAVSLTSLNLT